MLYTHIKVYSVGSFKGPRRDRTHVPIRSGGAVPPGFKNATLREILANEGGRSLPHNSHKL